MLENLSFGKLFASKRRTISILTILSLIIVLFISSALAHNQIKIVFGPKQYTRTTGKPDHFKDTFQAQQGKGKIFIKNGNIFQHDRHHNNHNNHDVDSASISLNGKQIFSLHDFNHHRHFMIAPVNLKSGQNTIEVELKSKPGSYLTIEIIQIGTPPQPKPTVTISANPASIVSGAEATLTWTSTNADTCTIDNGIGEVSLNGSLSVNPAQTTTYTIIATGPGGSVNASTTITVVPVPTVTISAQPATITAGGTSTLSWTSTNATTCSIDQGIGSVAVNGTRTVSPANTTKYTITATGPGGTVTASVTVKIRSHIDIIITSPLDGDSLTGSSTMVTGTVNNSSGIETGVTVNGIPAALSNNQFAVNNVPLTAGQNTITVTATDTDGTTATKSITVNATITGNYIKLSAYPESGTAPLTVSFVISAALSNAIVNYQIDFDGDGVIDYSGTTFDNINYTYTSEGIFYSQITVTDSAGNSYSSNAIVVIQPKAQLEILLKAKWESMKSALRAGDMETALSYFMPGNQEKYRQIFTALGPAKINSIFSGISSVYLANAYGKVASCGALRAETGGTYSYPLTFVQDGNAIWKIFEF